LALLGELIDEIEVEQEKAGGDPGVFEEGEIWLIKGQLFHRAHGFEDFAFSCFGEAGQYEPDVSVRFEHDALLDTTIVSLVYPLLNSKCAAYHGPEEPIEPEDGCASNQNSLKEALLDLKFSAANADPFDRTLPEFQLIAGWEFQNVGNNLNPENWRIAGIVGTAYAVQQADGARFIWTNIYPSPCIGDFDGNGLADDGDVSLLNDFISVHDGDPLYDDDGSSTNSIIDWHGFAGNLCLFNTSYDGFVDAADAVIAGDMDLNQLLDIEDVDDFIQSLLDPEEYGATHGGTDPLIRGDLNDDGNLDGGDIDDFVDRLMNP